MNCRPSIALIFLATLAFSGFAQGNFSAGFKFGAGGSPIPLQATLNANDSIDNVYAGTTLLLGLRLNYMISNRIGIESGVYLAHYSYYRGDDDFWRSRVWKGSAALEVIDFQLPLLIVYRYNIPSKPFMDITLESGTTVDWFAGWMPTKSEPVWLKNVVVGITLGYKRMKGGRLEYGLELQHSLRRLTFTTNNDQIDYTLNSRLGLLSLNLSYLW